jgi:putative transposase
VKDDRARLPRWRRHHRLALASYAQPGALCSITIAVRGRRPVFADPSVATAAVKVLREHAGATGVTVYAYCIMPDHVHLLLEPSATHDVITFVGQFKNLAQRAAWRHGVTGAFWQRSFWDHFLRVDEDIERVVAYVLNNPVRAGLVPEWRNYPFSGSLVWNL